MEGSSPGGLAVQPRRGVKQILKSYFYWTYPARLLPLRRDGDADFAVHLCHAAVLELWRQAVAGLGAIAPITIVGSGSRGLIITVDDADVNVPKDATDEVVKRALRKAIEPVTGDAVFVEHWETRTDGEGNLVWKMWAHR